METIVIMTEGTSPYGKYVRFNEKGTSRELGRICRGANFYDVYYGDAHVATRSNKDIAICHLQRLIKADLPGEVKFRWNVMRERCRFA